MNLPAIVIILLISFLLTRGAKETARFNAIMVVIKLSVMLLFIVTGVFYVKPENWTPFMPFGFQCCSVKHVYCSLFPVMDCCHDPYPKLTPKPWVPFIPLLSAAACGYLMYNLGSETWIGFIIWLAVGLLIYSLYGYRNSKLNTNIDK